MVENMAEINLLPWREKKREQEKKQFTTSLIGGVLGACLIVFLMHSYATHLIDTQTARNQLLQNEIALVEEQIKEIKSLKETRDSLISRMTIIQNLQSTRTVMVHLFDELIRVMPSGVYIYKLERKEDVVTMWGYAQSNTNVSLLMKNMEQNAWLQNPSLTEIKKIEDAKMSNYDFSLNFNLNQNKQVD
jgi:type IV pilus assembly protein PilN